MEKYEHKPDAELMRLMTAHPLLFNDQGPGYSYLMPGWYDLVDKLCSDIEAALGPEGCKRFELVQVKEKFGALRLTIDSEAVATITWTPFTRTDTSTFCRSPGLPIRTA